MSVMSLSFLRSRRAGVGAVIIAATLTVAVVPSAIARGSSNDPLRQVRRVTSSYRNVDNAIDAGYVQFFGCVHEPLAGAMGIHFVNADLAGDTEINIDKPEALMYEKKANGQLELLGVEYIAFKDAWDAAHPGTPPELFGLPFNTVTSPNRYGVPTFYELHAWAWKANPHGAHEDWNAKVLCPDTEGHTH
jgi:hypothetical protein